MSRYILFVTGTRADFGKLEPLAVAARDAGFTVAFFVTGMHMLQSYGLTKLEVHRMAGVTVHEFLNQRPGDPQDMILAKTVIGFSDFVQEHRPDLVVIHGDRVEALATALVCATNYIRCAHVEGGEVSGTIDEIYRHCNSKLASHHFVSSDDAARRVMSLGEQASHIHAIGSPELDFHAGPSGVTIAQVKDRYALPFADYGICVFHPVTSEAASMGAQAQGLFAALAASGRNFVVIAPNNDPGSAAIFCRDRHPAQGQVPGAAVDAVCPFQRIDEKRSRHGRQFLCRRARGTFSGAGLAGYRHTPDQPREIAVGVLCQCGRQRGNSGVPDGAMGQVLSAP